MKKLPLLLSLLACMLLCAAPTGAQARPKTSGFRGAWNYAEYAQDKSELPPAYQSMKLEEVPQYAIDITIKQTGTRLRATCGIVANYLARVEDCGFTANVVKGVAQFRLQSGFGGSATIKLTVSGDKLRWKTVRRKGVSYYPEDVTLRRLKPGETPPYFEKDDARLGHRDPTQAASAPPVQTLF
jgi:hypothetical protein